MYTDYSKKIQSNIIYLHQLRVEGIKNAKKIIGKSLFLEDIYFLSLVDKCLRLTDGFLKMIESRNLTCSGFMLRIQLDICMRTYAIFIAEDKDKVQKSIFSNKYQLNKLKSEEGVKMTDGYLSGRLNEIDPTFKEVYKNTSGYIHHSEQAFYSINRSDTVFSNQIAFDIGHELPHSFDKILNECIEAFNYFVEFFYKLLDPVIKSKEKFDNENQ
ncbi:hypothetical protein [Gottfriedia solisilvae]|uniref:Uncharacterized protein n=1 Tax=Gottfriedia solisilvae TaxID=1516104 RepID=A0A8J3AES2_9BACI|nr:hypothetical protein [Gottfriedia solisilvae]GGI12595.1 hypothetical protein GCM10007380_13700 [Gottfriedia solisilvae]